MLNFCDRHPNPAARSTKQWTIFAEKYCPVCSLEGAVLNATAQGQLATFVTTYLSDITRWNGVYPIPT